MGGWGGGEGHACACVCVGEIRWGCVEEGLSDVRMLA